MTDDDVKVAHVRDLDPVRLYQIMRLRADVFVVEQHCAYGDLDGRDLEPGARQLWIERADEVVAVLRLITEDSGWRIGRVATSPPARGQGLAERLVRHAVALAGQSSVVLDAQSPLQAWYERLGFVLTGPEFVEDGIPHVPMIRAAAPLP